MKITCCNCGREFTIRRVFRNHKTARYCPDDRCQRMRRSRRQAIRRAIARCSETTG